MALHLKSTGIDFTDFSNSGAMTSELLDAYEQGRWTATATSGGSITTSSSLLQYVKVGNHCTLHGQFQQGTSQTTGDLALQSLPFANVAAITNFNPLSVGALRLFSQGSAVGYSNVGCFVNVENNASTMQFYFNVDNGAVVSVGRDDSAYAAFTITFCSQ